MKSLIINDEDEGVLREELHSRLRELDLEILHTDRTDFRAMLKHRRIVIQRLVGRMETCAVGWGSSCVARRCEIYMTWRYYLARELMRSIRTL